VRINAKRFRNEVQGMQNAQWSRANVESGFESGRDTTVSVQPRVSVIVPHYRDLAGLDSCLADLLRQTVPKDSVEIIVADNNSPEGEAAVAEVVRGRAKLVVVKEKGAGPARNGGVAAASGEILAFTDSDCRPARDWLERGLAALERDDLVGGRVDVFPKRIDAVTPAEGFDIVFGFDNKSYVLDKKFTVTANLFCRRSVFDSVGGFLSTVSEDVEWSHRAQDKGYTLGYADDAVVDHPARRTWDDLLTKWRRVNAETYQLHVMYRRGAVRWLLRCLALPLSAIAHAPRILFAKRLPLAARGPAALMLFRLRIWRSLDCFRLFTARP
jgi:cellulose synthase/poly-beta-1,6-N-acetylglucosamine synthase-like glycosyltransferase